MASLRFKRDSNNSPAMILPAHLVFFFLFSMYMNYLGLIHTIQLPLDITKL